MTKHTPGPWRISYGQYGMKRDSRQYIVSESNKAVASVLSPNRKNPRERAANARLIAAAPKMLEVLKIARAHVSPALQPNIYKMMDDAIAKAEEQ